VNLRFETAVDADGQILYCYVDGAGADSPTLRVYPGDELKLTLANDLPPVHTGHPHRSEGAVCGGNGPMTSSTTNLHFHGMSIAPSCHQDDVLRTLIQPGDAPFEYRIRIPENQPPGLYWYHPHAHGFTEPQVLGGASGALIVEGIERVRPRVAGLPERVLILRDQRVAGKSEAGEETGPGKDISLNYVPVLFPLYFPAEMPVRPRQREFWRVLNAAADTYFNLQLRFGPNIHDVPSPQRLDLVALDGVAVGAAASNVDHVLLPPGARAEFIVTTPGLGVFGQLVTLDYDTGPDGEATPYRVIANIRSRRDASPSADVIPSVSAGRAAPFRGLLSLTPARERKLYFSEDLKDPAHPKYFITVEGHTPHVFRIDFAKPDLVAVQGTVEDWIIENRAREAHNFHIHQLHFQLLERAGEKVDEPALRDTVALPPWDGKDAYPSVKLRMDFRNPEIVGTFVYHCHILEHEDGGMMGSIRVIPPR